MNKDTPSRWSIMFTAFILDTFIFLESAHSHEDVVNGRERNEWNGKLSYGSWL
jgi:hypothetical protein